jgi:hypothetical protein
MNSDDFELIVPSVGILRYSMEFINENVYSVEPKF